MRLAHRRAGWGDSPLTLVTMAAATERSGTLLFWEVRRSTAKPSAAVHCCRPITIPIAWSITDREANAFCRSELIRERSVSKIASALSPAGCQHLPSPVGMGANIPMITSAPRHLVAPFCLGQHLCTLLNSVRIESVKHLPDRWPG